MRAALAVLLVIGTAPLPVRVSAQSSVADPDAYFESCVSEYVRRGMGNADAAAAYCYPKAYGSETTGGGENSGWIYVPVPVTRCWPGGCDYYQPQ